MDIQTKRADSHPLNAAQIEKVFNHTFFATLGTILQGGASEPIYIPKGQNPKDYQDIQFEQAPNTENNSIFYRADYASSALHEVAHWCIAGEKRRRQLDYGYWYSPDGRDLEQQKVFEKVEVKPQALEYAFSLAANIEFRVSADNLSLPNYNSFEFSKAVISQYKRYQQLGFPPRAQAFITALKSSKQDLSYNQNNSTGNLCSV
ncbi:elongation factor P hydroxylase [Glaciecola sp. 1036]|uniref:elongation factor P hydroxylase n=1 Tax=Alteromonadaceae TaxID=72275 RepID=UPI003D021D6E